MIYLTRGASIAAAEKAESAQRLEARGFRRVSAAEYRRAWQARDMKRRIEMAKEDEAAKLAAAMRPVSG